MERDPRPTATIPDWTSSLMPNGSSTSRRARSLSDVPVVVDFVVHRDAMVWPMVPAGVSNDKIQNARGMAPVWDREE